MITRWWDQIYLFSGTIIISASITYLVSKSAWISEDAFITLRYVSNLLNGYGPVFNPGEYVQGYTHPLWFIILTTISFVFPDPILNSIYLGLVLTFSTLLILGFTFFKISNKVLPALGLLVLTGFIFLLSDSWISFQTSGLENSLTHFLIATILAVATLPKRIYPGWLVFLMGTLCLNRPDLLILVFPSIVYIMWTNYHDKQQLYYIFLAFLPILAWIVFAWFTYGDIIPNSAHAKVGIYTTYQDSVAQGLKYIKDWMKYETLAAGSTIFALIYVLAKRKSVFLSAFTFGVLMYGISIIWIGGGFMRGRLFTPVFFSSITLCLLSAGIEMAKNENKFAWKSMLPLVLFGVLYWIQQIPSNPGATISKDGIVNERAYYPGYSLAYYTQNKTLKNPYLDLSFADDLASFTENCGPVTIHYRNPGTIGYLAGPEVHIIDMLGLTDSYIANLPNEYLVDKYPRPGHPIKEIPTEYLIDQEDISNTPGWKNYIIDQDCSILNHVKQ
jgi:arabinofuranosyltransferase